MNKHASHETEYLTKIQVWLEGPTFKQKKKLFNEEYNQLKKKWDKVYSERAWSSKLSGMIGSARNSETEQFLLDRN